MTSGRFRGRRNEAAGRNRQSRRTSENPDTWCVAYLLASHKKRRSDARPSVGWTRTAPHLRRPSESPLLNHIGRDTNRRGASTACLSQNLRHSSLPQAMADKTRRTAPRGPKWPPQMNPDCGRQWVDRAKLPSLVPTRPQMPPVPTERHRISPQTGMRHQTAGPR